MHYVVAADFTIFAAEWVLQHNHPLFPDREQWVMKMFFKRSFGELTKFVGNRIPKFSSKTRKRTLILIRSWSLDIIISRSRKPGLMLVLWISFSKEITNVRRSIQETSNVIEDTFSACNIWKGRMFEEINNHTACALGSEKYIKWRTRFCRTRIFF